jgi:hypothetical protein
MRENRLPFDEFQNSKSPQSCFLRPLNPVLAACHRLRGERIIRPMSESDDADVMLRGILVELWSQ